MHRNPCISRKTGGFTLVEILTVLVIIGLMSSAVVMTLPREEPAVIITAKTLHAQVNAAAQNSILSGQTSALALSSHGYDIRTAAGDDWTVISRAEWPQGVHVGFMRSDQSVDLPVDAVPLVIFEATGLSTVFELNLSGNDQAITLSSLGDGKVMWGDAP